jgi:hypothetical protein
LLGHRIERPEPAAVKDEMIRNIVPSLSFETYPRNPEHTFRALAPSRPAHESGKTMPKTRMALPRLGWYMVQRCDVLPIAGHDGRDLGRSDFAVISIRD